MKYYLENLFELIKEKKTFFYILHSFYSKIIFSDFRAKKQQIIVRRKRYSLFKSKKLNILLVSIQYI